MFYKIKLFFYSGNLIFILVNLFTIAQTLEAQFEYNDYGYNGGIISHIQNGRIHTNNKSKTSFIKCKKNYRVNSNSSVVIKQVQSNGLVFWIPKNGYLYKNARLCASTIIFILVVNKSKNVECISDVF